MLQAAHRRMRRDVDAYLDGELRPARVAAVEAHLDECWGCNGYADTVRLMKRSLRRLAERRPTDLTVARLRRWAEGWGTS
ncbi:MAG TPA: zf-HC2 domain-containing protein [Acidimicrobiales bacterium]|jgi:anti-sigma factor RsiW|nr:zf-HC2 domain-containing protein [Acidimicrobiales bacterium]